MIHIFEGKIDKININGKDNTEKLTAFPNLKNNILNLRNIEMGLDQINRLYQNQAKLTLQASQREGYSNINIVNQKGSPIFTRASIASNGISSTGKGIGSFNLYLDNLLGLNSQLSIGVNGSLKQSNAKRSLGYSLGFSIPYGYFLFSAGYREFLYRSTIYGENDNYISSGKSTNYNYNIDYTFFRNATTSMKSTIGLSLQQNLNFIANELIKTSSMKLTTGRATINGFHKLNQSTLTFNITLHKGLSLFDPIINSDNENKEYAFTKYTTRLSANTDFALYEIPFNLNSSLSGQYSENRLHNQELFSMGGFYSVRGFSYMGYYGEIGSYIHNDFSYKTSLPIFGKHIHLSPYIGLDAGLVEYDKDIFKHMMGSGFGVKTSFQNFNLSFDFGIPLFAYDLIAEEEYTSSFSLSYQY